MLYYNVYCSSCNKYDASISNYTDSNKDGSGSFCFICAKCNIKQAIKQKAAYELIKIESLICIKCYQKIETKVKLANYLFKGNHSTTCKNCKAINIIKLARENQDATHKHDYNYLKYLQDAKISPWRMKINKKNT